MDAAHQRRQKKYAVGAESGVWILGIMGKTEEGFGSTSRTFDAASVKRPNRWRGTVMRLTHLNNTIVGNKWPEKKFKTMVLNMVAVPGAWLQRGQETMNSRRASSHSLERVDLRYCFIDERKNIKGKRMQE